jgi:flagellum-specific ATP synthase
VGAYSPGSDPVLDEAIGLHTEIEHFLQQQIHRTSDHGRELGAITSLFD